MKQLFLALFLVASFAARAQPSAWTFVHPLSDHNGVQDVATDDDGNTYVTGRFTRSLQLGTTLLTSTGAGPCLYVAKCNASGKVLKSTLLEGARDVLPQSITVDKTGNCYVTGTFVGTLTYNNGRHTTSTFLEPGGGDIFLAKISADGVVRWISQGDGGQSGSPGKCISSEVAVDQQGNSYIAGLANGPNIGFGTLRFGAHRFQGFLASFDRQGQLRWAHVLSALPPGFGTSGISSIVADNAGSCYVGGNSVRGWTLNGFTLLSPNATDYLARFETAQGALVWAVSTPGTGFGHVALDKRGTLYVGSSFRGTADFGTISLSSTGGSDIFVARYTPQGTASWATALGTTTDDDVNDLAVDQASGNVLLTGTMNYASQTSYQAYLAQLNPNGRERWVELVGGPGTSTGRHLAIDTKNTIYTAGLFTGSCRFGPFTRNAPSEQGYFGRYGSPIRRAQTAQSLFPNPAHTQFTVQLTDETDVPAVRATLYTQQGRAIAEQTSSPTTDATFDTSRLPDGLYILRLTTASGQTTSSRLVTVQH